MPNLNDIKRRIKSVKNTQQITKAMKMVAAAKLRKAQEDIAASRPYAEKMFEMVGSLTKGTSKDENQLMSSSSNSGKIDLVLFTSDRGLCGGFNTNLIRAAERFLVEHKGKEVRVRLVGTRGNEHFKKRGLEIPSTDHMGSIRPQMADARERAQKIIKGFLDGDTDEVYILYGKFVSALTQTPTLKKLLPFEPESGAEATGEVEEKTESHGDSHNVEASGVFTYEPSEAEILETLLPKAAEVMIFNSMLETAASEHAARMAAMDNASKNAKEMIGSLNLVYNRARQSAITTELTEIVSGAEALKG